MNLIFFLIAVFFSANTSHAVQKKASDSNEVIWTIKDYSKKLKKETGIQLTMYGVTCAGDDKIYDGKVHLVDVGYCIDKNMKYDEARKLFYSIVDGLLVAINEKDCIRDCFFHYPVGYEDLYFRLNFDYHVLGHLKRDEVSMIGILENEIKYFIVEEDGEKATLETKQIIPDVYIGTGLSPKIRCITKKLPEMD
ncbi:MAG: hypothetical protein V4487_01805 [Chlamydiota bacterium]